MKDLHFLSGLPRSGSTLLGALLSQRPDVKVSATSGLIDIMGAAATTWETLPQTRSGDASIDNIYPVLRGMVKAHYSKSTIAIDKSRGWPAPTVMETMTKVLGRSPRIIATVRPIAECLASFIKISKWDKAPKLFTQTTLAGHLFNSYATLKAGWEAHPENFLFVEYGDLVNAPQMICDKIADFLGLSRFAHTFENLSNPVPENDEKTWGIPDLHFVRPNWGRSNINARDVLGDRLFEFYQGGEFWNDKPEPVPTVGTLDLQLEAGLRGDFDKGWEYAQQAKADDVRAQFNKGWYLLRRGELHKGLVAIDRGREENLIGHPPKSIMPIWRGQRLHGETVVLQGENGQGDQIINARFAKDIAARGGRVVIACAPPLAPILSIIDGVSAVVQQNAAGAVYHHYHVPMMSACRILDYEYGDLDGRSYIRWPSPKRKPGYKVGICWRGDPGMMHDEYRQFDPQVLFDLDAELISLQQKWDGFIPSHVKIPTLDVWEKTASVIADLDLVISSCTAVAHLSAAMGKPTWILLPLLPYYLWALPGTTSPWYRSVRLFRQTAYKDWTGAFAELREAFNGWREDNQRTAASRGRTPHSATRRHYHDTHQGA